MAATKAWVGVGLAAWLAAGAALADAAPQRIDWRELQAPATRENNPFAALTDEQSEALRELVVGRMRAARGAVATEAERQRRVDLGAQLSAQGIDADALLARRVDLISQRQSAAEAGVAALEGRAVRLDGYLLPAAVQGEHITEFLLVPSIGACSHMGTPPPNQTVRLRPAQPYRLDSSFQSVTVAGTLRLRVVHTSVYLVDGPMELRSSYAMDDAIVQPYRAP